MNHKMQKPMQMQVIEREVSGIRVEPFHRIETEIGRSKVKDFEIDN